MCLHDERHEDAQHRNVSISINGARPLSLDLCERHHRELIRPVLEALAAHGVDETQPMPRRRDSNRHRRRSGPFKCLVPGCNATPLKHTGTLWQHLRGVHEITLDEYREQYGDPVPLSADEQAELVVEARCPVDGCSTVYSTELGNRWPQQALVSHLWGHHGIKLHTIDARQRSRA